MYIYIYIYYVFIYPDEITVVYPQLSLYICSSQFPMRSNLDIGVAIACICFVMLSSTWSSCWIFNTISFTLESNRNMEILPHDMVRFTMKSFLTRAIPRLAPVIIALFEDYVSSSIREKRGR